MHMHRTSKFGLRSGSPLLLGGLAVWLLACDAPAQDVHGRAIRTLLSEEGAPTQATSWSGTTVEALSPSGDDYERLTATIDARGEFTIPSVPAGPFWLVMPNDWWASSDGKLYVWTDAREVDLGDTDVGVPFVPTAVRPLGVEITGLLPTQSDDHLEAYSSSHHWSMYWGVGGPTGADRATWPPGAQLQLRERPGERLIVKQWRTTTQDGVIAEATVRAGSAASPDENTTALSIPLTDFGMRTIGLRVDAAAFDAEVAALPRPLSGWWGFSLNAVALPNEPLAWAESLLRARAKTPARDANLSGLAYTDPYPATYARRYKLTHMSGRSYPVPGESMLLASCGAGLKLTGDASALDREPLRPRISLPQGLEIDGRSAQEARADLRPSPTVRWQPPRQGQVAFYLLKIYNIGKRPNRATPEISIGTFLTTETTVRLPRGLLQPGEPYFAELVAVGAVGHDPTTAPRRAAPREDLTDTARICSAELRLAP